MDKQKSKFGRHPDESAWLIWAILVLVAVAVSPFVVRNSEIVRQLATMCGFVSG